MHFGNKEFTALQGYLEKTNPSLIRRHAPPRLYRVSVPGPNTTGGEAVQGLGGFSKISKLWACCWGTWRSWRCTPCDGELPGEALDLELQRQQRPRRGIGKEMGLASPPLGVGEGKGLASWFLIGVDWLLRHTIVSKCFPRVCPEGSQA